MITLTSSQINYLFSAEAVSHRSQLILQDCLSGHTHFAIDWGKLEEIADYVILIAKEQYTPWDLPLHSRWRHFVINNENRAHPLFQAENFKTRREQIKSQFDLAIISVLLDAGAGANWHFYDKKTNQYFNRSEGLAMAFLELFLQGFFSNNQERPWQVNAERLKEITLIELSQALQVSETNSLVGLEGRLLIIKNLARVLLNNQRYFTELRPADLLDDIKNRYPETISAVDLLHLVLITFSEIWPSLLIANISVKETENKIHLGDVWEYPLSSKHSTLSNFSGFMNLIPFHKLSIWLTYSLIEPLLLDNIKIVHVDQLPGLAEYRNGGLFMDGGVLVPKNMADLELEYQVSDPFIIEWRALTLALLSQLSIRIGYKLNLTANELPLVKLLQAGTWLAGRKLAYQKREDGGSPVRIQSNATIF